MNLNVWSIAIILSNLILVAGCSSSSNSDNTKVLINMNDTIDTSVIKASPGVKLFVAKTESGNAVKMECGSENPVPEVIFNEGKDSWHLSNYRFVAVDITNLGKKDIFVESQLAGNGWYSGGQNIEAGKTRTIRAYIQRVNEYPSYLDKKFIGMDALPGGIIKAYWWTPLHPDSIHGISVLIANPRKITLY